MSTDTEQALLSRAKAGDQDAFAELVAANEKRIYNLSLRMTGNPDDAQEVAQEAFLNAWRGLSSFKGDSSFSTWIYRLASNAAIDFLRREKRHQDASLTYGEEEGSETQLDVPDGRFDPHTELEQQELRRAVERGLMQLSTEHRQVLVMREISGLSYDEIGQTLSLSEGTVKSRIARARLSLRKILMADRNFFSVSPSEPVKDQERRDERGLS